MLFILVAALVAGVWAQDCGVKPDQDPFTDYIVGGRNATPGNWPWQLSLQIADQGAFRHTCGASVLTTDWALTAAHCVHNRGGPEDFRVVAGAHNIKELSGSEQIIYIDMIIKHENYSQISLLGFPNDICLLRLSTPLDLSVAGVGPACLAQPDMGDFASHPDCWISGWGLTHWTNTEVPAVLQEALVPVPTNAACSKTFVMLRDSHVCSGDGRPSACRGDSGGPMTCKVDDTWYVVGVASFGVVFCQGVPMVYTRVSSYVDWVDDTMTANARP